MVSSFKGIKVNVFEDYYRELYTFYLNKYPWYNMPTSAHKLLVHGATIIKSAILPIGQLSEEALESSHKYFKKYRRNFSRQCNRSLGNFDIMRRLILTSEPKYAEFRTSHLKKSITLSEEASNMLELD